MIQATSFYQIVWRPKAEEDLVKIIDYITLDSPVRAETFGHELRDKVNSLSKYPEMGRVGRPGLPGYVRELVIHRNYIAFYRVRELAGVVEILRLKHVAQRMP
ncbi:type II toxin-antitoxin system RelE/ParE family toxin [Alcaligenes faecalis]|uniref:type II toxin-antitoxin system RelE/ParE family toxin n=1 Tax=Alcaligenes faecalis TaxID=511 RepID=UPI000F0B2994|nr:type II toxin-antitoxin system RelE/ParE family toxin [Alcaligenes faecalis]AYR19436.1 type II toxin-antitoxin system RelE/ParE family toxin [Alcaligenes faecalis]